MENVPRRDDGFGVEVAQRLALPEALPAGVKVIEVGIGGVHVAHEVMNGYDALVLIDAIERSGPPGTVHVLTAEVPDLASWTDEERADFLSDTHYTTPRVKDAAGRAPHVVAVGIEVSCVKRGLPFGHDGGFPVGSRIVAQQLVSPIVDVPLGRQHGRPLSVFASLLDPPLPSA